MLASRFTTSFEPNITPMLDVLLVLIVTFMAAIDKVHHTIDAQLPQPCSGVCEASTNRIVLEVLPGGRFRINKHNVAEGALGAELASIYNGRPEKVIQVAGYPGVRYQEVFAAMDVARSSGVLVIGVAPKVSDRAP